MAGVILGPNGTPISTKDLENRKADPPKLGQAFGHWAGRDVQYTELPGGGVIQFDLSKLELSDFRQMRDHYQINSSLAVLSFMQHQSDFHIECEDKRIAEFCEESFREVWTLLNRAMSQSNWAGFSPNVLDWENDIDSRSVRLHRIRDLIPDECVVNWKDQEGWAPPNYPTKPKYKVYDGIKQMGMGWPIPVDNSFWYPLLMENGDYYGRKLLRPAFTSWFFSLLVHLFANRYYERFGEPTPIGRAPFDDDLDIDLGDGGTRNVRGNQYMLELLQQLRSRSVVVLPNDHTQTSSQGTPIFDYDIEYLESQMRGADFERYLTRLDEEMSIGLFTPILLLRTADVGSYNLGVGHMQMYLWMLNAMNDDRKHYLDRYILGPMVDFAFSPKAPRAKIIFRKMGNANVELIQALLESLASAGKIEFDVRELGQMAGMTIREVNQTVKPPPAPDDPSKDPSKDPTGDNPDNRTFSEVRATADEITRRVRTQVTNAFRDHSFTSDLKISLGYKRKMEHSFQVEGIQNAVTVTNTLFGRLDQWLIDVVRLGEREFSGPDSFMSLFNRVLISEIEEIEKDAARA